MSNSCMIKYTDFNPNELTFTKPKKDKNGRIKVYINKNGKNVRFRTHLGKAPFGLKAFGDEKKSYSVNISAIAKNTDEDESVEDYYDKLDELDNLLIEHVAKYSEEIFGKKKSKEIIEEAEIFSKLVKTSKEGDYPRRLAPKIKDAYNQATRKPTGTPNITVYIKKENEDGESTIENLKITSYEQLEALVPSGTFVQAVFEPYFWVVNSKCGIASSVVQLLIEENNDDTNDCAFDEYKVEEIITKSPEKVVESSPDVVEQPSNEEVVEPIAEVVENKEDELEEVVDDEQVSDSDDDSD